MKLRLNRDLIKFEKGSFTLADLKKYWGLTDEHVKLIEMAQNINNDDDVKKEFLKNTLNAILSDRVNSVTKLPDKRMMYIRLNSAIREIFDNEEYRSKISDFFKKSSKIWENNEISEEEKITQADELRKSMLGFLEVSVISGDVSNLKLINDNLSHRDGDKALKFVGDLLAKRSKEISKDGPFTSTTHLGGDEFVLLSEVDENKGKNEVLNEINDVNLLLTDKDNDNDNDKITSEQKKFKENLTKELGVSLHIDFGSAHISEGILLLFDICNKTELKGHNYCDFIYKKNEDWFIDMEKQIAHLTADLADRRALFNKISFKLSNLIKLNGTVLEKYYENLIARGFTTKKTLDNFLSKVENKQSDEREVIMTEFAEEIIKEQRKLKKKAEESVYDVIDYFARLGM